jgi:REP-associated tyrosine transposase
VRCRRRDSIAIQLIVFPCQPRIEIPGLLQHVIFRGVARSDIFLDDDDREDFVQRLSLLLVGTETRCYAWALLNNHVHLLLMPNCQPLAPLMRRLLTGFAVSFNRRHDRAGHLFQNRYKSLVCDDETYLLELVRYIHLNPLRAGAVKDLEELAEYRWCGHRQFIGKGGPELIDAASVLALFAAHKKAAVSLYLNFLDDGVLAGTSVKLSSGGRRVSQAYNNALRDGDLFDERILGGGDFVAQVLGAEPAGTVVPISLERLVTLVADHCKVAAAELSQPNKQPTIVRAKALICFVATRFYRISGSEVGEHLGYSTSAVSRAAQRGRSLFEQDCALQKLLNVEM